MREAQVKTKNNNTHLFFCSHIKTFQTTIKTKSNQKVQTIKNTKYKIQNKNERRDAHDGRAHGPYDKCDGVSQVCIRWAVVVERGCGAEGGGGGGVARIIKATNVALLFLCLSSFSCLDRHQPRGQAAPNRNEPCYNGR